MEVDEAFLDKILSEESQGSVAQIKMAQAYHLGNKRAACLSMGEGTYKMK